MALPDEIRIADCSLSLCSISTLKLQRSTPAGRRASSRFMTLDHRQKECYPTLHSRDWPSHFKHPTQINQRAGRKESSFVAFLRPSITDLLIALFLLCLLCPQVSAQSGPGTENILRISQPHRSPPIDTLTGRGELLVDRSEPPVPRRMRLAKREDATDASKPLETITIPSSPATTASSRTHANATTTVTTTTSSIAIATASPSASALPRPFDTSLGNNFTTSCLPFFNSFLSNSTFEKCVPFSLLLQTSQGFFQASKSLVRVTQVLDASCNVDFSECNSLLSSLATQIKDPNNCGTDYANNNPIVLQAYYGFESYQTMYQAGCLKDSRGGYCFADAITNSSSITDSYPYYLPLDMPLPGGSRPTCSSCLQRTMEGFADAASNASQPISLTYETAAEQINVACGPNFVNATVQIRTGGASVTTGITSLAPFTALLVILLSFFF